MTCTNGIRSPAEEPLSTATQTLTVRVFKRMCITASSEGGAYGTDVFQYSYFPTGPLLRMSQARARFLNIRASSKRQKNRIVSAGAQFFIIYKENAKF